MQDGDAERWIDWGGQGPRLHFAHANGFPPRCYRELLEALSRSFRVGSWQGRPLWPCSRPDSIDSWRPLADDLVDELSLMRWRGVVGVGHSLGGVLTLLAAARSPELFSGLVVVDPVVFAGFRRWIWQLMKTTGQVGRLSLLQNARRRADRWPHRGAVRQTWMDKPFFASWTAASFDAYLEHGLRDGADGSVHLRYPKAWEARIFELTPHNLWPEIQSIRVPILAVRGERSTTFLEGAARRMVRRCPAARCETIKGSGHLVPMEKPAELGRLICDFANQLKG